MSDAATNPLAKFTAPDSRKIHNKREKYDAELHERILRQKEYFNPYITGTLLCFSVRRNPCRMDLILQKTVSPCLRICYIKMESYTVPESMITLIYKGE